MIRPVHTDPFNMKATPPDYSVTRTDKSATQRLDQRVAALSPQAPNTSPNDASLELQTILHQK